MRKRSRQNRNFLQLAEQFPLAASGIAIDNAALDDVRQFHFHFDVAEGQ
jgi:hypothetical protein